MSETAALAGSGLHKRFLVKETGQTVPAVTDVSLEISAGTLTALVGPDGAGKTTLLRMMAGLMKADEGRLEVLGIDVAADGRVISSAGSPVDSLYYLGPWLRPRDWEATAVPELREHAARLAAELGQKLSRAAAARV